MNVPIKRLLAVALILFGLLVGFTSKWAVFDAEELEGKTENKRPLFEAQQIKRGKITTSDGEVIANSNQEGENESTRYVRNYPLGSLFGNPVGYSFITQGNSGLEQSENAVLTGEENEFTSILDQIRGRQQQGSDIVTTLDAGAQRVAADQLAGRPGAVVAIEPKTGAVRVMQSTPGFDPEPDPGGNQRLQRGRVGLAAAQPGDSIDLPTRLDDEGRDGRGRARLRCRGGRRADRRPVADDLQRGAARQ